MKNQQDTKPEPKPAAAPAAQPKPEPVRPKPIGAYWESDEVVKSKRISAQPEKE